MAQADACASEGVLILVNSGNNRKNEKQFSDFALC